MILASWSCSRFEAFKLDNLDTEMEFKPFIIAPLAYGSFDLQDVLEALDTAGLVQPGKVDTVLSIYYTDTVYSVLASEIVDLSNMGDISTYIEGDIISVGWGAVPVGEELTIPKIDILDFEIEPGDQIDSVLLKSGSLNIVASSEFRHPGTLHISSPNIFKPYPDGDTLDIELEISDASGSLNPDTVIDLAGYKLEISEDMGMAFLRVNYLLTLEKENNDPILSTDSAEINISFEDMEFSHVYGFVSDREILDVNETLSLDFFDIAANLKNIKFKAPEFNLHADNSYGIPMKIDLSSIQARSTGGGLPIPLEFDPDSLKTFTIKAHTIDSMGYFKKSIHNINGGNSNLEDILESSPNKLDFDFIANTGTTPGVQNFLLDTSRMDIVIEVVLPMWLQTGGFELQKTIDMDIGSIVGDLSFVDSATITLNYINELPLEVRVQGYFLDSAGTELDSLFSEGPNTIDASPVDENGVLDTDPAKLFDKTFEVGMTGEQMSKLSDAVSLYFEADASTSEMGTKFVKFYSHYKLSYSLFIDAHFRINTNELD